MRRLSVSQLFRQGTMRPFNIRGAPGLLAALIVLAALLLPDPAAWLRPAALIAATAEHASGPLMLPDLREAPVGCPGGYAGDPSQCTDWDVCMVRDDTAQGSNCTGSGPIKAVRLRFTTSEENSGDGPLLLYGHRHSTDHVTMIVRQAFQIGEHGPIPDSYATAQREVGAMYYDLVHQHWSLLNFNYMELRKPTGDTVVSNKNKNDGFCLGDRYTTVDAGGLLHNAPQDRSPEGSLAESLNNNQCQPMDSSATDVKQGLSVGRGDTHMYNSVYDVNIASPWLDITHVPSGTYVVVNTANSDRTLLETNYDNNSSAIAISLQWPGGAHDPPAVITSPPVVKLLNSCPGRAQCSAD